MGTKFLVDCMLGKLARGLRMLGYDAQYYRGSDPAELLRLARQDDRVVLTRNSKLKPVRGEMVILIKENSPSLQLKELIGEGLISLNREALFSRCLLCNQPLERASVQEVEGRVPDFVFYQVKEFNRCPCCDRIYWKGSHQRRMQKWAEDLFGYG